MATDTIGIGAMMHKDLGKSSSIMANVLGAFGHLATNV